MFVTQVATEEGEREGEAGALSDAARKDWEARVETLAAEGYRVLAFAERQSDSAEADPYEGLTLLGLVGLEDPPRDDVPDRPSSGVEGPASASSWSPATSR